MPFRFARVLAFAASAALGGLLLLSCERDFEGPYTPGSPDYVGPDWSIDSDGDGVSDSVEKYNPSCKLSAQECVAAAKELSLLARQPMTLAARDMILWKGEGPTDPRVAFSPGDLAGKGLSLSSSDPSRVSAQDGKLQGLDDGEARVTVSVPGLDLSSTCRVRVVSSGKKVKALAASDLTLVVGESRGPALAFSPRDASHRDYNLTSESPEVAAVTEGNIRGVAAGAARIVAESQDGGHMAAFTVTVTAVKEHLTESIRVEDMSLLMGDDPAAPKITWTPSNATNKKYQLAPRDPSVADVDEGKDRMVPKSPGETQVVAITLDGSGKTAQFTVRVSARPVPLRGLTAGEMQMLAGSAPQPPLLAWDPPEASNRNYTLKSDNPGVAAVEAGLVKPLAPGKAVFTATSEDGEIKALFNVTVLPVDNTVHVDSVRVADMDLAVGTEREPEIFWHPAQAGNRAYTLTSANPSVAEPSASGLGVQAKAPGEAVMRLEAADGGRVANFVVRVFVPVIAVETVSAGNLTLWAGDPPVTPLVVWTPPNATDKRYVLESSDPMVAAISSDSLITPAGPGNAIITLRAQGVATAQFQVAVAPKPVAAASIEAPALAMQVGEADRAVAVIFHPPETTDKSYILQGSSNPGVAAVIDGKLVRAVAPGQTVITVETLAAPRLSATCTVTVSEKTIPVQAVAAADMALRVGEADAAPKLTWTPADATDKEYTLASDNPAAASIEGLLVGARGEGTANVTVTARDGGLTAVFKVTVTVPVTGLSAADISLQAGQEADPILTWTPAAASDKRFTLVSENPGVAAVTGTRVRGATAGTARVQATSADGGFTAAFTVTVAPDSIPVDSVRVEDMQLRLDEDRNGLAPVVTWFPSGATDKGYSLTVRDADTAAVNGNLLVPVGEGRTEATLTTHDGGKTYTFKVRVRGSGSVGD